MISEVRTGQTPYDLAYVYDRSGNRLKKTETIDASTRMETTYTYDIEDATLYGSANNRLMKYIEERVTVNPPPGTGETRTLLATTFYYYNNEGNVTRVVTQKANPAPGEPMYSATRMEYALNGRTVTFVMGETWNDNMCPPTGYTVTYAREFRYDSPRQRYLNRELDPAKLQHPGDIIALSSTWTDYDGDYGYGDFTETAGVASERRAFIPGVAMVDPWTAAGGASTKYFHTNLIGTTRIMSGPTGNGDTPRVLTAFGEPVAGQSDRYGYAGRWGYQTHDDFPFIHVGARYYDPASGRFLQRDPSGVRGGANVYQYVSSAPTLLVDPTGLWSFGIGIGGTISFGPWSLQFDISIHVIGGGPNGIGVGITATGGGGAGLGLGVSLGGVITVTDATSIDQLTGSGFEVGLDTPIGGLSVIVGKPSNPDRPGSGYSGGQLSFGPSMPILGVRAGDTNAVGCMLFGG